MTPPRPSKKARLHKHRPTTQFDHLEWDVRTAAERGSTLPAPGFFDAGNNKQKAFNDLINALPEEEKSTAKSECGYFHGIRQNHWPPQGQARRP